MNDTRDVRVGAPRTPASSPTSPTARTASASCSSSPPDETPGDLRVQPRPDAAADRHPAHPWPGRRALTGLDRDRAVDESGNQVGVFGRLGARPFNGEEMRRLYLRDGKVFTVRDEPPGPPASGPATRTATNLLERRR